MGTEIHLRGLHQCPGRVRGTISCIGHIVSNTWLYHLISSNRTWCKHHPWYVIHVLAGSATPTCGMVQDGMGETPSMIYPWEWHHHSVINEKCVYFILPSQKITCLSTLEVKLRHWNTQLCPELIWSLQIWAHVTTAKLPFHVPKFVTICKTSQIWCMKSILIQHPVLSFVPMLSFLWVSVRKM